MPNSIEMHTIADRTVTIRASVKDVQITLLITIALVVAVIFLFLRNVRATLIPSAVIPLSLLATAAVMLPAGFSLDNLSLMAMTIAVGFVVDDAIVMVEAIWRRIEHGEKPFQAALNGAGNWSVPANWDVVPVPGVTFNLVFNNQLISGGYTATNDIGNFTGIQSISFNSESATAPKTPPCMVIILSAARWFP